MKFLGTAPLHLLSESCPDGRHCPGTGEDFPSKGTEVETSAPHHEREMAALMDLFQGLTGQSRVVGGCKGRIRIHNIYQVVRDAFLFCEGRFGGSDVQATVDLHRVESHNLPFHRLGQLSCDGALPDRRRADECNEEGEGI